MAFIRVINNHTGDEGQVDETWLVRWPDDFTPLSDEHVPLSEQAAQGDPEQEPPAPKEKPSTGKADGRD